jgi:hypothetical protein
MFVKSVTEVPVEFDAIRASMTGASRRWLTGLAETAAGDHDELLVQVGLTVGGREVTRSATLEMGQAANLGDAVLSLPFHLRMTDHAGLFPELEGGLDAAWLGPGRTHLALTAQYEPPFGVLGRAADEVLLHRVAELVAQRFLEAIARRLGDEARLAA